MSFFAQLFIGLFGGITVAVLSARKWRPAGRALLFILVFEGVFRKWLLPVASDYIYFFKDAVLIGSFIGMWRSGFSTGVASWRGMQVWLSIIGCIVLLQVCNPAMLSPFAGLMGLKYWLLWMLMIFLTPSLFENLWDFERYVYRMVFAFLLVAGLAIVQFQLPQGHLLNQYVREQDSIASFGVAELVRVCSTFAYLTGLTHYLAFCAVLFVPVAMFGRGRMGRLMVYVIMPLLIGVGFMTGARSILFYDLIFFATYFGIGIVTGVVRPGKVVTVVLLTVIPGVVVLLASPLFRSAFEATMERTVTVADQGDSFFDRVVGITGGAFEEEKYTTIGDGTGSSMEPARTFGQKLGFPVQSALRPTETEPGRVMAETGLFGFIAWYGFKLYLIVLAWTSHKRMTLEFTRAATFAIFLYLCLTINFSVAFDHTLSPFYWSAVGLIFLMEKFDGQSQRYNPFAIQIGKRPRRHSPRTLVNT